MKKKVLDCIIVLVVTIIVVINIHLGANNNSSSTIFWANVDALASGEGGPSDNADALDSGEKGLSTNYNRHPFSCTIYGNGKIKIVGGSIIEIKGSLSFDGGLYCSSGGESTCTPIECAQLWQWIFD
jgi:hypothetical protein